MTSVRQLARYFWSLPGSALLLVILFALYGRDQDYHRPNQGSQIGLGSVAAVAPKATEEPGTAAARAGLRVLNVPASEHHSPRTGKLCPFIAKTKH